MTNGSKSRLIQAAATWMLAGAGQIRVATVLRWIALAAIPIVPTMVELAGWPRWVHPPVLPSFHVIYWWAVLVLCVGIWELRSKVRGKLAWQVYWHERARVLAGNIEEIGEYLLGGRVGGGKPASADRIIAGILQQVVDVVEDLTQPGSDTHITACLLVPRFDGRGSSAAFLGLQAITYNKNLSRNKSFISVGSPSPALDAYENSAARVVADTSEKKYLAAFEGRPYRSVMAFPANIGGRVLAVVTVDATTAGHFNDDVRVQKGIDAAIFPFLKLIGLARIAEEKGARRARN